MPGTVKFDAKMTKPTKSTSVSKETQKKPKVAAPRKPRPKKDTAPAILHYEPRSPVTNLKLKNAMVTAAKSLRAAFLSQKRRFITMFYLDPGYINGGAALTVIDLTEPDANFIFLWKIDLYEGEKAPKDIPECEIVDRMRAYVARYPRMFANVDIIAYEKQLERTTEQYANMGARQMGDVLAKYTKTRMFAQTDAQYMHDCLIRGTSFDASRLTISMVPKAKEGYAFDVGIMHRMYPRLYPEVEIVAPASMNKFAAAHYIKNAKYRHNKRCSASLVSLINMDASREKQFVSLDAERWLVDHNMAYHQQLRNDLTDKYDDYGDAFAPSIAFMSIVCADEHMMSKRADHSSVYHKSYVFVIPDCAFLGKESCGIIRYLSHMIVILTHHEFPFMDILKTANDETLCFVSGTKEEFPSWDAVKARCRPASANAEMLDFIDSHF